MPLARSGALRDALRRCESRFGPRAAFPGAWLAELRARSLVPTGTSSLDELLGGGLLAGEPHLFIGEPASGSLTLALHAAGAAQGGGGEVAWLDPTSSFDPFSAERAGVDLERVLVVRTSGDDLVWAAVTVARSAAFVLLVVDLGPRLAATTSVDALGPVVAQIRASGGTALLVLAEERGRRLALPAIELRRTEWLRCGGRTVGWRALALRARSERAAALAFEPLALTQRDLVDAGVHVLERQAAV